MKPQLGQHFLHDQKALHAIIAAAELASTDVALEIGPGKGILTGSLLGIVKRLVAVELDAELAEKLPSRFSSRAHLQVVHADFLKVDLDSLFPMEERPIRIMGNIPYAITSPIFEKLLAWPGWTSGVFLIQREVADRIVAEPGSRAFGILSLAVQLLAIPEFILSVPPESFSPAPKVTSSIIRLTRKKSSDLAPERVEDFFDLAHGAFAHRRKTLVNSLSMFSGRAKPEVGKWIESQGISPAVRAETLGLDDYVRMAEAWAIFRRETKLT